MTSQEFFNTLFEMDWMTDAEKSSIYTAAQLYAMGTVRRFLGQTITEEIVESLKPDCRKDLRRSMAAFAQWAIREFQSSDVTKEQIEKDLHSRLQNGRDYLMGVNQKKVVVEDALEAFGFRRSGLDH